MIGLRSRAHHANCHKATYLARWYLRSRAHHANWLKAAYLA